LQARILSLLVFIQIVNICWLGVCVYVFAPAGWSVVFLLAFEVRRRPIGRDAVALTF
jgi:hypothetical protein